MSTARILVVGSTMMDLISYAKVIPNAGETLVGDRFQMGFGGKGANQAVQAARSERAASRLVAPAAMATAATPLFLTPSAARVATLTSAAARPTCVRRQVP